MYFLNEVPVASLNSEGDIHLNPDYIMASYRSVYGTTGHTVSNIGSYNVDFRKFVDFVKKNNFKLILTRFTPSSVKDLFGLLFVLQNANDKTLIVGSVGSYTVAELKEVKVDPGEILKKFAAGELKLQQDDDDMSDDYIYVNDVDVEFSGKLGVPTQYEPLIYKDGKVLNYYQNGNVRQVTISIGAPDSATALRLFNEYQEAKVLLEIQEVPEEKEPSTINIITKGAMGRIELYPIEMRAPKLELPINYGKNFPAIHDKIVSSLEEDISGVYLFYGAPGTGKSTYIQYLASVIDRPVLFVTPNFVSELVSPDFVSVLIEHPELVIVIEDAEKAVEDRDNSGDASIASTLLNIGDGFLGRGLNISLVLTFNTEFKNIDKAFIRPGRLKVKHDFGPLSVEDAQAVANYLKKGITITKEMTLAEVYNFEDIASSTDLAHVTEAPAKSAGAEVVAIQQA